MIHKQYLGDAVYIAFDENVGEVVLTTEDGISVSNTICIEPEAMANMLIWLTERFPSLLNLVKIGSKQ